VVFLHGGLADKDVSVAPELARAIAGRGAVVVVPNWGQASLPYDRLAAGLTVAEVIEGVRLTNDEVACAVSYAVTHADEYGADPTRLVLVGASAGATKAGTVALTETSSFAGCEVPPAEWTAQGLMLWEGDWFMAPRPNDVFGAEMPAVLAAVSPWPSLATAADLPPLDAEFAVSPAGRAQWRTPAASSAAEWMALRDPTGQLQHDLEAVDAFADGFVDIGEAAEIMVNALNARGVDASLLELNRDPATTHEMLGDGDLDLMVEHVLALAGT
jgi:hypothetical protein